MSRTIEAAARHEEPTPVPPGMRYNDADLRRRLLGDYLASGSTSLLWAWSMLELARQTTEPMKEEPAKEIPF